MLGLYAVTDKSELDELKMFIRSYLVALNPDYIVAAEFFINGKYYPSDLSWKTYEQTQIYSEIIPTTQSVH